MDFGWPGEKFLIKLCDTLADKGIGSLFKPWQMRREGVAAAEIKRLNALMAAQTKRDAEQIKLGKKLLLSDGRLEDVDAFPVADNAEAASRLELIAEIDSIVKTSAQSEAFRKEVSLAKAILYAEQELAQETQEPPEKNVDDDWLFRWRDNASDVSSDELQALWGKVLAGEVKCPGTFSMRTLEFLRNISRDDAALIEKAAPYVIGGVIFRSQGVGAVGDLSFGELMELQDMGVVSGVEAVGMQLSFASLMPDCFIQTFTSYGRLILATDANPARTINLPIYAVTKIGREVLKLGWKQTNEANLRAVAERIKAMGFETKIGDYVNTGNDCIMFSNMVAI